MQISVRVIRGRKITLKEKEKVKDKIDIWEHPLLVARNNFIYKSLSCWSCNIGIGCEHACTFCASGDTLVQMANGLTKPLKDVVIGEAIIGIGISDGPTLWRKKFVEAIITAKVKTIKTAVHLKTDNAEVICSGDHRWLTTRGWKFTVGTEHRGPTQRPHLTIGSDIFTIGSHLQSEEFSDEYKRGYLCGIIQGDGVHNRYDYSTRQHQNVIYQFRLFMKDTEPIDRARLWLNQFGVTTRDFEFKAEGYGPYRGIRNSTRSAFLRIGKIIEPNKSRDWARGWLAGFFDAEGCSSMRFSNANKIYLERTETLLSRLGFKHVRERREGKRCQTVRFVGGIAERARFYQQVNPALKRKMGIIGNSIRQTSRVLSIKPSDEKIEMFDITTTCETFIANGLVSHNCYVPQVSTIKMAEELKQYGVKNPDQEWGEYFMLREWNEDAFVRSVRKAEKTPLAQLNKDGNRAVMYCTTTDPYQVIGHPDVARRKELVALMQAMVRKSLEIILEESSLNVRILTRSPMAKLDFDIYKRFGNRLLFGMSLPTLNNHLAKVYEPNVPSPAVRLQTLQAAKAAGIPIYVAMAPTYPECSAVDLVATLEEIRKLDPVTVFHEPINVRAENIARIKANAELEGVRLNTAVFSSPGAWATYAITQLSTVEINALDLGLPIHLWPDKGLAKWAPEEWLRKYWDKISEWPETYD